MVFSWKSRKNVQQEYAGRVESNDMIVDNAAMQLVLKPEQFDVMVTTNMFGDRPAW